MKNISNDDGFARFKKAFEGLTEQASSMDEMNNIKAMSDEYFVLKRKMCGMMTHEDAFQMVKDILRPVEFLAEPTMEVSDEQ